MNQQFMITGTGNSVEPIYAFYNLVPINPQGPSLYPDAWKESIGKAGLQIGDVVTTDDSGTFAKQQHINCEPAIVIGTDIISLQPSGGTYYSIKMISAFCPKYGDITIELDTRYYSIPNPFLYTQRGDKILVQNTAPKDQYPKFKIVDNITASKLRAKFLQEQQENRAKLQKQKTK